MGHPVALPQSSHNQRRNVLGFLQRDKTFVPDLIDGPVDTAAVVACMDQCRETLHKKSYVLIENAPMHRSQGCVHHIQKWVKKGLMIKYPYNDV